MLYTRQHAWLLGVAGALAAALSLTVCRLHPWPYAFHTDLVTRHSIGSTCDRDVALQRNDRRISLTRSRHALRGEWRDSTRTPRASTQGLTNVAKSVVWDLNRRAGATSSLRCSVRGVRFRVQVVLRTDHTRSVQHHSRLGDEQHVYSKGKFGSPVRCGTRTRAIGRCCRHMRRLRWISSETRQCEQRTRAGPSQRSSSRLAAASASSLYVRRCARVAAHAARAATHTAH